MPADSMPVDVESAVAPDFESLFEDAPCGYVVLSPRGRVVRANRLFGAWIGAAPSSLAGRPFTDLLNFAGKVYYQTHLAPLLRLQGRFGEVALDLVPAADAPLPVFVNAVERRDAEGRVEAVWLTVFKAIDRRKYEVELLAAREALHDLTATQVALIDEAVAARTAVEGTLRQSQKMEVVGQLTAGLAHDFNNILVSVSGAFELIERRVQQGRGAELGPYVASGKEALRRAIGLVARLLAFSRKQDASVSRVDVRELVAGMEDMVRRLVGSRIALRMVLASDTGFASIDANQLESALLNLCVNARDAMPDGGTLTVTTARVAQTDAAPDATMHDADRMVLTVADTGSGMSPEVASRVLEPFFTTKAVGQGTGLGLTMVAEFARHASGDLRIASQPGAGTTIAITLPRTVGP